MNSTLTEIVNDTKKFMRYAVLGNAPIETREYFEQRYGQSYFNAERAGHVSMFTNLAAYTLAGVGLASLLVSDDTSTAQKVCGMYGFAFAAFEGFAMRTMNFNKISGSVLGSLFFHPSLMRAVCEYADDFKKRTAKPSVLE